MIAGSINCVFGGMMHPADAGGNALGLGRDVLALARRALDVDLDVDYAASADEIHWAVEHAAAALRMSVAELAGDAEAVQEVLDGLTDVLAGLAARTRCRYRKIPDLATP